MSITDRHAQKSPQQTSAHELKNTVADFSSILGQAVANVQEFFGTSPASRGGPHA